MSLPVTCCRICFIEFQGQSSLEANFYCYNLSVSSNWPLYFSEARKKNKKKTSKNRSIPEDLGISASVESLLNTFVFHVLVNFEVITGTFLLGTYGIYVLQYLQRPLVNSSQLLTEAVNRLWLEGFNRDWKDREGTG